MSHSSGFVSLPAEACSASQACSEPMPLERSGSTGSAAAASLQELSCMAGAYACFAPLLRVIGKSPEPEPLGAGRGANSEAEFQLRIQFLGQVPLFKRLPLSHYPILARELRGVSWEDGQVVLEHGQQLTEFSLVAEGSAEVQAADDPDAPVHQLWPGDYFGEKVLQTGGGKVWHSPARVVAGQGLVTLNMTPREFEDFGLRQHLTFPKRRALSRCAAVRRGRCNEGCAKTAEQRKFIAEALRRNTNLRSLVDLQETTLQQLCDAASRQEVSAGTQVVQHGEYGGMFYIVESGGFQLRLDEGGEGNGQGAPATRDALARIRSGAIDQGAEPGSETARRRRRKEVFLQRLAHTQDLDGPACSPALTRQQSVVMGATATPSAAQHQAAEPKELPLPPSSRRTGRCRTTHGQLGRFGGASPCASPRSPAEETCSPAASPNEDVRFLPNLLSIEGNSPTRKQRDMQQVLGVRGPGDCFGELALLYRAPRTSSAAAVEDSVVWRVDQAQFRRIMGKIQQDEVERIVRHLGQVDLLQGLLLQERTELARNFLTAKFKQGDWLVHEQERQEVWYIILAGECSMSRGRPGGASEEVLATLSPPQHFGERALLRQRPSEFSVQVQSEQVECLVLDGPTFRELAGHLSAEDFRRAAEDDLLEFARYKADRVPKLKGFLSRLERDAGTPSRGPGGCSPSLGSGALAAPTPSACCLKLDPSLGKRALDRVAILGRGALGLVTLERDPTTHQQFALKTVLKKHIVQNQLQEAIRYERQILTMIDSPFIIRLHATFRDASYIYFLFEPLLGGELHSRMCREPSRFRDPKVHCFILACITLALEHLHERNVVFRDLKPENVLLDASGYVKLCDLGFAKFVVGRTATLCGTPEYMAPEVISHTGYDRMVDWWAVGVLAYELVCGCTPFIDEDDDHCGPEVVFANILATRYEDVELPRMPTSIGSFIVALLQFSSASRLGVGGAGQVKKHAVFYDVDFAAVAAQRHRPAYVPRVKTKAELARTLRKKCTAPTDEDAPPQQYDDAADGDWDIDF